MSEQDLHTAYDTMSGLDHYLAERDEVLRSKDPARYVAFRKKHFPESLELSLEEAETVLHTVRSRALTLTPEERAESARWLTEHNWFVPLDAA